MWPSNTWQNIGNRMNSLLDDVFNKIAGTTVLLSTLIPSVDPSMASCHDSVNSQYRNIVNTRSSQGQKILLAEMVPGGSYWNIVVGGDYQDNTHPTDSGHAKMASIWYETFKTAYSKGWITAPAVTSAVDDTASDNTCAKQYGNSESTKTQTQSGSGWDDGVYIHHGDPQGERFYSGEWPGEKQYFYMASLVDAADRNDDIIQYLSETSDGKRKYYLYRNNGPGVWRGTPIAFEVPDTCIARGVRWADMNGKSHPIQGIQVVQELGWKLITRNIPQVMVWKTLSALRLMAMRLSQSTGEVSSLTTWGLSSTVSSLAHIFLFVPFRTDIFCFLS